MLSLVVFGLCTVISQSLVPQVALCGQEDCPSVSRIGLGTLHLGDKISGLSDPQKINEWLQNGLAQGITLIDTAGTFHNNNESLCFRRC